MPPDLVFGKCLYANPLGDAGHGPAVVVRPVPEHGRRLAVLVKIQDTVIAFGVVAPFAVRIAGWEVLTRVGPDEAVGEAANAVAPEAGRRVGW